MYAASSPVGERTDIPNTAAATGPRPVLRMAGVSSEGPPARCSATPARAGRDRAELAEGMELLEAMLQRGVGRPHVDQGSSGLFELVEGPERLLWVIDRVERLRGEEHDVEAGWPVGVRQHRGDLAGCEPEGHPSVGQRRGPPNRTTGPAADPDRDVILNGVGLHDQAPELVEGTRVGG